MHVLTASVTDRDNAPGSASVTVTASPTTLMFPAVADTYVDGAAPTTAFGASPGLLVSSSPLRQAFLRFAVSGLGDFTVNRAVLRLTVGTASSDGSASGGSVSTMTGGAWSESVTAFASRPVIDGRVRATRGKVAPKQLFHGQGCGRCNQTGYYDRLGVFEVLTMTEDLKRLVIARAGHKEIMATAASGGLVPMRLDAWDKVEAGVTTVSEVLRSVYII